MLLMPSHRVTNGWLSGPGSSLRSLQASPWNTLVLVAASIASMNIQDGRISCLPSESLTPVFFQMFKPRLDSAQMSINVSQLAGKLASLPQQLASTVAQLLDSSIDRLQAAQDVESDRAVRTASVARTELVHWSS